MEIRQQIEKVVFFGGEGVRPDNRKNEPLTAHSAFVTLFCPLIISLLGVNKNVRSGWTRRQRDAALIREKPDQVLTLITAETSVFDRHDVARVLHRFIDGAEAFQAASAKVTASPALVAMRDEQARVSYLCREWPIGASHSPNRLFRLGSLENQHQIEPIWLPAGDLRPEAGSRVQILAHKSDRRPVDKAGYLSILPP
jgi:hypothetical protein